MLATKKVRSLWPKEHGAYAQLLVPLLTALALTDVTQAGLLWAGTACMVFVGHEAALVLLGRRGARAKAQEAARAKWWLAGLLVAAAGLAAGAFALAPSSWPSLLIAAGAGGVAVVFVAVGAEKSAPGEAMAAVALTSMSLPIMHIGGWLLPRSVTVCVAWALGFIAVTGGVRAVIAHHRARPEPWAWPMLILGGAGCLAGGLQLPVLWTAAPIVLVAWGLKLVHPSARHLRSIGVGLVIASLATAAAMVQWAR